MAGQSPWPSNSSTERPQAARPLKGNQQFPQHWDQLAALQLDPKRAQPARLQGFRSRELADARPEPAQQMAARNQAENAGWIDFPTQVAEGGNQAERPFLAMSEGEQQPHGGERPEARVAGVYEDAGGAEAGPGHRTWL